LVAKKAAGIAGSAAGSAAGGFFNNPGVIALAGIAITIVTTLLIFRKDISEFFGNLRFPELPGLPDITFPTFEFPDITFPTFEFPEFNFPEFPDINITFPEFNFPEFPTFGDPERMDVPFGDDGQEIDVVPGFGRDDPRRDGQTPTPGRDPDLDLEPSDAELFARDFPEPFVPRPEFSITRDLREIPFAVANVEETQSEFQERAAAFVEALPEVTAFTSLPGSATDFVRRQLSRESEDFEDVLAAEARRSETIFAGLFGNVQNPEFGA